MYSEKDRRKARERKQIYRHLQKELQQEIQQAHANKTVSDNSATYVGLQVEEEEENLHHNDDVFAENVCNESFDNDDNIDVPINENTEDTLENLDFEEASWTQGLR